MKVFLRTLLFVALIAIGLALPPQETSVKSEIVEEVLVEVEPEPVVVEKVDWQTNPNNCDPKRIRADNLECLPPLVNKPAPAPRTGGSCEDYRGLVSQYSWNADTALLVMSLESGCDPNAVSPTNDHGLFQLNGQPVYDPAQNIAIAYGKYVGGRVGSNNYSAWYAVCSPGNNPQPKYPGIHCQ